MFLRIEIDQSKRVNDPHGHAAGDLVLVETGQRLLRRCRPCDHVVRWGGEEFAVVLRDRRPGTSGC